MDEREEILSLLPQDDPSGSLNLANAYVYVDKLNRLCILPIAGGMLWVDVHKLGADIAPWAD